MWIVEYQVKKQALCCSLLQAMLEANSSSFNPKCRKAQISKYQNNSLEKYSVQRQWGITIPSILVFAVPTNKAITVTLIKLKYNPQER